MKLSDWQRIEEILASILELPEDQREVRIDQLCAGSSSLRSEVISLLAAHNRAGSFLEVKTQIRSESAGNLSLVSKQLGPYRLLEPIGHGGMGTVYRAERADGQFQKQVAVKVVPAAIHSQELLRRFSGEQQILASLEHPNIARLLDAGISPDGVPYLVMEYVEGVPITDYCRDHHLSVEARLRLFQTVCSTVHFAHQHLIVHRDIKPANILVTMEGIPKLLDFGIAKLLDPLQNAGAGSTQSIFNPMTPDYASPEQTRGEALTTATDVYSLGVILYELLANQRPYSVANRSSTAAARIICDLEPEKPSALVRYRKKRDPRAPREPGLSSELDALVAKAMRKDAQQRYDSAQDLAQDISRYLGGLTVLAHRGSLRYAIRKFVGRHKLAAASVLTIVALIVAGVSTIIWQAQIALHERDRATAAERSATKDRDLALSAEQTATLERNRARSAEGRAVQERNGAIAEKQRADTESATARAINDFLQNDLLAQASASSQVQKDTKPDPDLKVRTALDRAATGITGKFDNQPLVEASIRETIGRTYKDLGLYEDAEKQGQRVLELRRRVLGDLHPDTLAAINELARLYQEQGKYPQSEPLHRQAIELLGRVRGAEHPDTLAAMHDLAHVYRLEGKYPQAEALFIEVMGIQRRVLGDENPETLRSMDEVAFVYQAEGRYAEAEPLHAKALELLRRVRGPEHPQTLNSMQNLALAYYNQAKFGKAEPLFLEVLELQKRVLGPEHPDTTITMKQLAGLYQDQGKYAQAEPLLTNVIETRRRVLGENHPFTTTSVNNLAMLYMLEGKYAKAEPLYVKAVESWRQGLGAEHPYTLVGMSNLGRLYHYEGKYAQAEALLKKALEGLRRVQGEEHPYTLNTMSMLGLLYLSNGSIALAEPLISKVAEGRRRALGADHPRTLISLHDLACLYVDRGDYARAESLLSRVLEAQQRIQGREHPDTLNTMNELGVLYRAEHKFTQAESLLIATLEARRRALGGEHPDTLESMNDLAIVYASQGRYEQAEPLSREVSEVRRRVLGKEHPNTANALSLLASIRLGQLRYTEAESLLGEALQVENERDLESWQRYEMQSMLGACLAAQSRFAEAEPLLLSGNQGLIHRQATIPWDNRSAVEQANQRIIELYQSWGKLEKAEAWRREHPSISRSASSTVP